MDFDQYLETHDSHLSRLSLPDSRPRFIGDSEQRADFCEVMATSLSVPPDKFDHGDFNSWLRNFDVCATANGWSDADKLRKFPAFLRGQASSFYHTLGGGHRHLRSPDFQFTAPFEPQGCP